MIGATLGAKAQQTFNNLLTKIGIGGPGSQIGGGMVAASEGSKQMLNLFFNMPEQAKVKIMLDLLKEKKKNLVFFYRKHKQQVRHKAWQIG